jgi:hypothetical protein
MTISEIIKHFFASPRGVGVIGFAVVFCLIAAIAGLPLWAAVLIALAFCVLATAALFLKGGGAKAVVGEKERLAAVKNRERIDAADAALEKLKNLRLADEDVKKSLGLLCFKADSYLANVKKDPDCHYDPRALASLDAALEAVNVFLRQSNQTAMEEAFGGSSGTEQSGAAELLAVLQSGVQAFQEAGE